MEWWWVLIPGFVGVIGLAIALSGLGWMFRGKPFKGGRGVLGGAVFLGIAAIVGLIGLNVQTYNRISHERVVATVSLAEVEGEPRTFDATVVELDEQGAPFGEPQTYRITGDQWQMDARVFTWKPWANVIGLDSQYEFQRIWGRDVTPGSEDYNTAAAQDLQTARPGIDVDNLPRLLGGLSPVAASEREFGSAVFMPMVNGATYRVIMTQEALAAEPGNDIARGAIAAQALARGGGSPPAPQQR